MVAAATTFSTSTATAETAGGTLFTGPRFVHRERPALKIFLMESFDGLLGILLRPHFHEAKAARTAGKAILHDVDGNDGACRRKVILQIIFGRAVVEVTNE